MQLYDDQAFILKNTVINKIVPDFIDTVYFDHLDEFTVYALCTKH